MTNPKVALITAPRAAGWNDSIKVTEDAQPSTNPVHSLTGFEPFAARGAIVTDELIHQLRDEACV